MKKLQVQIPDDLYKELKLSSLEADMYFGVYVIQALKRHKLKMKRELVVAGVSPETAELIQRFNDLIGDNTSPKTQQTFAQMIINKYGLEQGIKAIEAAKQASGMEYAPSIGSIKQLFEKWNMLKNFVFKFQTKAQNRVFIPVRKGS